MPIIPYADVRLRNRLTKWIADDGPFDNEFGEGEATPTILEIHLCRLLSLDRCCDGVSLETVSGASVVFFWLFCLFALSSDLSFRRKVKFIEGLGVVSCRCEVSWDCGELSVVRCEVSWGHAVKVLFVILFCFLIIPGLQAINQHSLFFYSPTPPPPTAAASDACTHIVPEITKTSSYIKSNRTPMKMLIDHEMSKEVESKHSPPNLVAKLMGLDALPQPEPKLATKRIPSKAHSRSHSDIPMSEWEQQQRFSHYKDIHEVCEQPQRFTTANDKKMALVRQKFLEAKRLSMDGRLRQSKQFQDALEVLSSNRDLFLECLQEPSSVFAQQLYSLHSIPIPETKRITVLRPSKIADEFYFAGDRDGKRELEEKCIFAYSRNSPPKYHESPTQPIRIVVLKPSLDKILDNSKVINSPQSQSAIIHSEGFLGDVEDNANRVSRQVAKEITNQMREKLGSQHRDETVIYSAVESSFDKSEIDEYPSGDISESEATSPVSRHSWDYVKERQRSPFSSSSFSRESYSLESSVCREAKKRLSERWALMASNGSFQELRQIRRGSSTLGEMLALSESKHEKNEIVPTLKESVFISNEKLKDSNSMLESGRREVQDDSNNSLRNLTRSKSVPVSSSQFGSRLEVVAKEGAKARSGNSSFKGKVSSLFFSRSKKGGKDKAIGPGTGDESGSSFLGEISCDGSGIHLEEVELSSKTSSLCMISPEEAIFVFFFLDLLMSVLSILASNKVPSFDFTKFSVSKPAASGNIGENQDQPSPISVLDPTFELNERTSKVFPRYVEPDPHGYDLSSSPLSSNFIDKSPLIGSIARTLLWDDSSLDTALTATQAPTKDEGREWYLFARTLLSMTGLESEAHHDSFFARWHSPESPLDPSLRDTYIDLKNDTNEARRRQKRSMQKLVFDCLNVVLVELVGPGQLADEVWARMNCWFSGDENGFVVERAVRNEVAGKGWVENLRFERDILGKEIEVVLFEMLLEEAVIELDRFNCIFLFPMFSQFEGANETRTTGLFLLFPVHRPYLKDAQRRREDLVTFSFPKSITTDDHLLSAGCLPSFGNKLRRRLLGRRRLFQSIHNGTNDRRRRRVLSILASNKVPSFDFTKFSVSKPAASGNIGENQDQPSPISVLDPTFELNERTSKVFPRYVEPDPHGYDLSSSPLSSNFIDKSPLIGSIARTLLWDDSSLDTALTATQAPTKDEGQEWYLFARTLLSMTGLESEAHHDSFFARWHSPESPLDPSLRDTYIDLKNDTNEARRRQKRSMQKLVFDCLNVVLVELVGPGQLADEVWARMNCWFSGDENGFVVERAVRNEVAGKGWVENLRFERDILGKEIEGVLFEMLLEEAVIELDR
ncbi:hypothetical protein STAS_17856 [Striga asiatica]|uniref:DUF4378 domain-containing protein n=1 Tax=Striga asiatica TaxID=4170 RepID=A0A5A7Q798_STRAF|nr:hypothetical protein STAS_17856 [Striga asiatica]